MSAKSTPYLEAWDKVRVAEDAYDAARAAWVAAGTAKAVCDAVWNSARTAKVAAEAAVRIAAKAANDARAAYLAKATTAVTP